PCLYVVVGGGKDGVRLAERFAATQQPVVLLVGDRADVQGPLGVLSAEPDRHDRLPLAVLVGCVVGVHGAFSRRALHRRPPRGPFFQVASPALGLLRVSLTRFGSAWGIAHLSMSSSHRARMRAARRACAGVRLIGSLLTVLFL